MDPLLPALEAHDRYEFVFEILVIMVLNFPLDDHFSVAFLKLILFFK